MTERKQNSKLRRKRIQEQQRRNHERNILGKECKGLNLINNNLYFFFRPLETSLIRPMGKSAPRLYSDHIVNMLVLYRYGFKNYMNIHDNYGLTL